MEGALKREVMRRRSIETQQIASWKKEQILQDIENLKIASQGQNINNTPQKPVEDLKSPSNDAASKLSKLSARKMKNLASSNGNNVALNFDAIQQGQTKPKYNVGFDLPSDRPEEPFRPTVTNFGSASTAVTGNAEVDAMIQEKKYFLSRLNTDNEKMTQLLQDMKECKQRLRSAIESVEAERDRLKGYQVDISSSCIDQFLMDGSDGSLSALLTLQASEGFLRLGEEQREERRAAGEEVRGALLALIARHKANQHEQNELVFGRIQAICARFSSDFSSSVESFEAELEQLRAVVDVLSGPSLVSAGDQLSQHIIDAVVEYAVGNKAVTAAAARSNVMLKDPSRSAMKASEGKEGGGSAGGGGGGSVTVSQSEWDELQAANESLKASLAKMSKSNAQLRAAAATNGPAAATAASSNSSSSGAKKSPSPLKRAQSSGSVNNNNNNTSSNNMTASAVMDDESDAAHRLHNTSTGSISVPPVSPVKPIKVTPQLPPVVADFLHSHLTAHIQQLLEGHPIAATGIPSDVFYETAKELASQVQPLASTALVSYAHHRGVEDLMTCVSNSDNSSSSSGSVSGGGLAAAIPDEAVRGVIQDGVRHTVQVAAVHAEITTLATLYLTYLHSRYGLDGRPRSTTPGTAVPSSAAVPPAAPVPAPAASLSPVAQDLGSSSRDTLEYDPSGYTGLGGSQDPLDTSLGRGSAAAGQSRLGPVSHTAREYVSRSMSTNNMGGGNSKTGGGGAAGGGEKNVPRYMQPKRAATMTSSAMTAAAATSPGR